MAYPIIEILKEMLASQDTRNEVAHRLSDGLKGMPDERARELHQVLLSHDLDKQTQLIIQEVEQAEKINIDSIEEWTMLQNTLMDFIPEAQNLAKIFFLNSKSSDLQFIDGATKSNATKDILLSDPAIKYHEDAIQLRDSLNKQVRYIQAVIVKSSQGGYRLRVSKKDVENAMKTDMTLSILADNIPNPPPDQSSDKTEPYRQPTKITSTRDKINTKARIVEQSMSKKSNEPDFSQRIHQKIDPRIEMYITSSGREGTLVSNESYFKLRHRQAENLLKGKKLRDQLYTPETNPELGLRYPVLIGKNGQMVAIMKSEEQKLGEGGFGVVYLGMDIDSGKQVAVKYQTPRSQSERKNVNEEIAKLDSLGRLVSSLDLGIGAEIITIDELGWGEDYNKALEKMKTDFSEDATLKRMKMALGFLSQIAQTHQDGYLHRDIKTDNMLWDDKNKKSKVIDFGYSVKIPDNKNVGQVGTPLYISPEIIAGKSYSIGSDIYACGIALIEIFSSHDIFDLKDDWLKVAKARRFNPKAVAEIIKKAASDILGDPPPPDVPPQVIDLIKRMIDLNVKKRPPLTDAMLIIQEQIHVLEYYHFMENEALSPGFSITSTHVDNPHITNVLYEKVKIDDLSFLDKINPSSVFLLLHQAAKDDNIDVFEALANRYGLFEDKNAQFAQSILKTIMENAAFGEKHTLFYTYFEMAAKAGKFLQAKIDFEDAVKPYNIVLETPEHFVDSKEQLKFKNLMIDRQNAKAEIGKLKRKFEEIDKDITASPPQLSLPLRNKRHSILLKV